MDFIFPDDVIPFFRRWWKQMVILLGPIALGKAESARLDALAAKALPLVSTGKQEAPNQAKTDRNRRKAEVEQHLDRQENSEIG
jgi:hypothetical protein